MNIFILAGLFMGFAMIIFSHFCEQTLKRRKIITEPDLCRVEETLLTVYNEQEVAWLVYPKIQKIVGQKTTKEKLQGFPEIPDCFYVTKQLNN